MSSKKNLLTEATNPQAYDAETVDWAKENGQGSKKQELYREYFDDPELWQGKQVIDAGCGTGWLCNYFKEGGASSVTGLEPSIKNLEYAKQHFSGIEFILGDLMNYEPKQQYDLVTCVMVLMNLPSPIEAIRKLKTLAKPNGNIILVVPDYEYFRAARHGYKLTIEDLSDDEYVERVIRPDFTVTDIIRKTEVYEAAGKDVGLSLITVKPLVPSETFRKDLLQYEEFKDKPLMHLLHFKNMQN